VQSFVGNFVVPAWALAVSEAGRNTLKTNTDIVDQCRPKNATAERNEWKIDVLFKEDQRVAGKLQNSLA